MSHLKHVFLWHLPDNAHGEVEVLVVLFLDRVKNEEYRGGP